jgi:hypothetical protein
MSKNIIFGVSFPREIVHKIDKDRGDIPRSRFLLRLIETAYAISENQEK